MSMGELKVYRKAIQKFVRNTSGNLSVETFFEIQTVNDYSKDYHKCTEEAAQEVKVNARPELTQYLDNVDSYDNVFVCGPCWWGTFPMPVFSQMERLDFTGKKVMVLMTHEGSGLGSSERDLRKNL